MMLETEEDVLKEDFRIAILKEIEGRENLHRKAESMRRYDIYKDKIKKYVVEGLKKEGLLQKTVDQMANRCANISIARKIVNKLARAYSAGVQREVVNEDTGKAIDTDTKLIEDYAKLIKFDEKMRKGDRFRELQKNMLFQVVPEQIGDAEEYRIALRTLSPWHYDIIEDAKDHEIIRCVILSDYCEDDLGETIKYDRQGGAGGYHQAGQEAAPGPNAPKEKKKQYVWWTDKYHFTTDEKGALIADVDNAGNVNPIARLPFINNADEQDGYFWAEGGDDLIDGTILVNKVITDMLFIAYQQGWGQMVITGKGIKDDIQVGVNNVIILDYEEGDPEPKVSILNAQPPLDQWMSMVEQYVALLLTTNNLSPSNVAIKLNGASEKSSGIAMLIERSEATDDITDKQNDYQQIEEELWKIVSLWHNLYFKTKQLTEEFLEVGALPEDPEVRVHFNEAKPVISEKEKLDSLLARKNLGLNTDVDLIMQDNPGMSKEEAEAKLLEIKKEKLENMTTFEMPLKHGVPSDGQVPQAPGNSGSGAVPGGQKAVAAFGGANDAAK